MKTRDVHIGQTYLAKVSGKLAHVRIESESRFGGWEATNLTTNKPVRVRSPQRLRCLVSSRSTSTALLSREAHALADRADPNLGDTPFGETANQTTPQEEHAMSKKAKKTAAKKTAAKKAGAKRVKIHAQVISAPAPEAPATEQTPAAPAEAPTTPAAAEATPTDAPCANEMPTGAKTKATKATKMPKAKKEPKAKKVGGLTAAVQILREAKKAMTAKEMVEAAMAKGLWKTNGKTPEATVYSAIIREIANKGDKARFARAQTKGQFVAIDA